MECILDTKCDDDTALIAHSLACHVHYGLYELFGNSRQKLHHLRLLYNYLARFMGNLSTIRFSDAKIGARQKAKLDNLMRILYFFMASVALKWMSYSKFRSHRKLLLRILDVPEQLGKRNPRIQDKMNSSIIYLWFSPLFQASYLGQTIRGFQARSFEHYRGIFSMNSKKGLPAYS